MRNPLAARRIDTHHHVVPDFYADWLGRHGLGDAGGRELPRWTAQDSIELMRACHTETAILSVSMPGIEPATGAEGPSLARDLNEYCHEVARTHPGRFGYFATLCLPDVDASIVELHHAYDRLGADGVVLLANAHGTYLGDPAFEPLMAELDARHAVVFVHPQLLPGGAVAGIAPFYADFLLDTTRAALNLGRHGVVDRYPGIRFILAHGGGFIPYASVRLTMAASPKEDPFDGLRILRKFYYDTALASSPFSMPSLLRFVPRGRVLFGSDYPFAPADKATLFARALSAYPSTRHHAINRGNAETLFPRFADRATRK